MQRIQICEIHKIMYGIGSRADLFLRYTIAHATIWMTSSRTHNFIRIRPIGKKQPGD